MEPTLETRSSRADALQLIWPDTGLLAGLNQVDLLATWLRRRLEQLCLARHPELPSLGALQHLWFGSQAASLFLQRRHELDQVLVSLLQLDDGHLAQELWFRLRAAEADFHQLLHHAIGPERDLAGRIGPVALADLDARLLPILRRLAPGELAAPIANPDGTVLLLRLERRWPARLDEDTRALLEQDLFQQWRDAQLEPLLRQPPPPGSPVWIHPPEHR